MKAPSIKAVIILGNLTGVLEKQKYLSTEGKHIVVACLQKIGIWNLTRKMANLIYGKASLGGH